MCGSGHVTSGTGNNGQLLLPLLLFVACRFHLEHLVEAAGELLGDPSLARLWETGGGSEADGGWFGLHGFVFLDMLWRCRCLSRAAAATHQNQRPEKRSGHSFSSVKNIKKAPDVIFQTGSVSEV